MFGRSCAHNNALQRNRKLQIQCERSGYDPRLFACSHRSDMYPYMVRFDLYRNTANIGSTPGEDEFRTCNPFSQQHTQDFIAS